MKDLLLLHDGSSLEGALLRSFLEEQGLGFQDLDRLAVATQHGPALDIAGSTQQPFSAICSVSSSPGFHTAAAAAKLCRALKPNGVLIVYEPAQQQGTLRQQLLLGGLAKVDNTSNGSQAPHQLQKVTARRPDWETGARAAISLKSKGKPAVQQPPVQQPATTAVQSGIWSLPADEAEELIDEDELLTEEDRMRPPVPSGEACAPSKKACANCTCGRAEEEAAGIKASLTADMLENPKSACGSCGLGDAFRCSTCPYRGLPNFQMGQKITISSDFLTADA